MSIQPCVQELYQHESSELPDERWLVLGRYKGAMLGMRLGAYADGITQQNQSE